MPDTQVKKTTLKIRCEFCKKLFEPKFVGLSYSSQSRKEFWDSLDKVKCSHCGKKRKSPKKEFSAYRAKKQV